MPTNNGVIPYNKEEDKLSSNKLTSSFTMPKSFQEDLREEAEQYTQDELSKVADKRSLAANQSQYHQKKYTSLEDRLISDERINTYKDAMNRRKKEQELERQLQERKEEQDREDNDGKMNHSYSHRLGRERKRRWDVKDDKSIPSGPSSLKKKSRWQIQDEKESNLEKSSRKNIYLQDVPIVDGIPLSDLYLNVLLPPSFKKVPIPDDYEPKEPSLAADKSEYNPQTAIDSYMIPEDASALALSTTKSLKKYGNPQLIHEVSGLRDLQFFKESDMRVFGKLIATKDIKNTDLNSDELNERKCLKLILRIKNGTPSNRKTALRSLTDHARSLGPDLIFNIILPLMLDKTLEEQERHLLVKVIGRVLFKLNDLVRPFTNKILVVIMPLLIDENLYTRLEGREIISNLAKASGLSTMISTLRPDIDHSDDYVRNLVARTLAVTTSSLGIQSMLPFLKAVCNSKKSWLARHTGVKTIQQIGILMGSSILPYLNGLINCISKNIEDSNLQVRTLSAMCISALAQASAPYGYESFQDIIEPLWQGLKKHRGKSLAAFVRALGNLIPLMDEEYGNFYTKEIFKILNREFNSPIEEMQRAILIVIQQCCSLEFIDRKLLVDDDNKIINSFFMNFWSRKIALDKNISKMCVDACYSLALKIGPSFIIDKILISMREESKPYRKMAVETANKIISNLGSFDLDDRQVERLLDGLLYSFQNGLDPIFLNGFGNILNSIGIRVQPHLMQVVSALLYRLKNQNSEVREQAADLISRIAPVLKICGEDEMLIKLGAILYEGLGEAYPDVLGSLINALRSVIDSLSSIELLNPPVSQVLPTLTPILRNRHEKVQEAVIILLGNIAGKSKDYGQHKEWMKISFQLLEMLKAHKKQIRIVANNTFGLISKAIGPADVLVTLLNNLRVQERQLRVCTAVAIGIVAETCSPYTILPALMNEYRYPDTNTQNGILKSMSFMFEYIGDMGSDYIYSVISLLQDALTDKDLVHRQTAATVVKHMALGSYGLGYDDAFIHFLNLIWPNIFETSPHVISRIMDCIESLRVVIGSGYLMNYIIGGLFHPARKVRGVYWKLFNNMYVNCSYSIVPYYPRFEAIGDEVKANEPTMCLETTDYGVEELDLWI